ncbi:unnamed protein product, partial [Amoebophrya sp. A25]
PLLFSTSSLSIESVSNSRKDALAMTAGSSGRGRGGTAAATGGQFDVVVKNYRREDESRTAQQRKPSHEIRPPLGEPLVPGFFEQAVVPGVRTSPSNWPEYTTTSGAAQPQQPGVVQTGDAVEMVLGQQTLLSFS